jgi:hypothetical protein
VVGKSPFVADDPKLTPEQIEALRAGLLPDREAMSLLTTQPGAYVGAFDELPSSPGPDTGPTAAGGATDTAGSASHLADADASGHGTESVTDADRSDQITQSDTASSQT